MTFVLAAAAETDLRAIVRHTRDCRGAAQARDYAAKRDACMSRLAIGEGAIRRMDSLYPGLRMIRCEHHHVFCLPRQGAPALVIAILHERMDLMVRLAERFR